MTIFRKIPAGNFIIPFILSAVVNSFYPVFFDMGGLMGALLGKNSSSILVALIVFAAGSSIDIKQAGKSFLQIKWPVITKIMALLLSVGVYFVFSDYFKSNGLAFATYIACMSSVNPGLMISLLKHPADHERLAFGVMNIFTVPVITLMFVSFFDAATSINPFLLVTSLLPFVLGIAVQMVFPDYSTRSNAVMGFLIPFLGWSFGANINLIAAMDEWKVGLWLTLIFYVVIGGSMILAGRRASKGNLRLIISMQSVAGAAMIIPTLINDIQSDTAMSQIAFVVVLTTIITSMLYHRMTHENT